MVFLDFFKYKPMMDGEKKTTVSIFYDSTKYIFFSSLRISAYQKETAILH